MPRRRVARIFALLFTLALVAAACGDDSDDGGDSPADDADEASTTEAPSTTATIPEGGEAITGLSLTMVAFGADGAVTITNDSAEEVSVDGLWLCNRPSYTELSGSVPAGGSITVPAAELGGLPIEGGEVALYTSNDFASSDDILDYVQWGAGGGRESVAVAAGLWTEGGSVEPDPEFGAIERFDAAGGPEGWE